MTLLGPNGQPISSSSFSTSNHKKGPAPITGEAFGSWAGEDIRYMTLPGGGAIQFDLSRLTIGDFRQMKDHYQINSSLAILTFMMHQTEWHIEADTKRVETVVTDQLTENWTRLIRGMAQAFWAGFSPMILQWDNDTANRSINLDKIKDLIPEDCKVNWKTVKGWSPPGKPEPKLKIYDGIVQLGYPWPIPVDNTLWYPLLMENGDYYGRKLLRPAFTSWFFSILLHLFANRYYERFGEPTPVGRAPFDETISYEGSNMKGNDAMRHILTQLRNRSVVVLPNDKTPYGEETNPDFDYQIEYLESQMRGADFERYMTRLDEEMSLAMFTPILMMRTADVGSYNLGVGHTQVYLWMLNAILADWAFYINKYIIAPMVGYNFSVTNPPKAKIVFTKMGKVNTDILRAFVAAMGGKPGGFKPELREFGEQLGMTLEQIDEVTDPAADPDGLDPDPESGQPPADGPRGTDQPRATATDISARIESQVVNAFKKGTFGKDFQIRLGYRRRFEESLRAEGYSNPEGVARDFYQHMEMWANDVAALGPQEFPDAQAFMSLFRRSINTAIDQL